MLVMSLELIFQINYIYKCRETIFVMSVNLPFHIRLTYTEKITYIFGIFGFSYKSPLCVHKEIYTGEKTCL